MLYSRRFEAPVSGGVTFFVRLDSGAGATLVWSGNETVAATETLATTPAYWTEGLRVDGYANAAAPPILHEMWKDPTYKCSRSTFDEPPCVGEMAT